MQITITEYLHNPIEMKNKVIQFITTYLLFIILFLIQKPLFMLYYSNLYKEASLADYISVMWHGLKLDASIAGYLTALPGLILIASLWTTPKVITYVQKFYYGFVAVLLSLIFVSDLALYQYWGFRLDSTPLFYLKSPASAFASAEWWMIVLGFIAVVAVTFILFTIFNLVLIRKKERERLPYNVFPTALCLLLLTGLLFIPIRGGFTVSTMNVGKVYFSSKMELNHAAINPCFSLIESLTREQDFGKQYRFMEPEVAKEEFAGLIDKSMSDSIPTLFTVEHPNVIIVVLESFMSKNMETLGGFPNVASRMDELSKEGILFTNVYANSFRTDRGLVSIFSGYPGQPTTSIMKYPRKTQTLPSIPKSLKEAGYNLQYYYGGDADFTNMRSYLMTCGIDNIISDKDFPLSERLSKWGALDHVLFNRFSADVKAGQKEPFFKALQTSSSHEPFDVPYHKHKDLYLNSVAYTDSCLGAFIDEFKQTEYWKNSVVIMVPDHAATYPAGIDNHNMERYQIPLLMVGGALKHPMRVDAYASQIDIAATLLSQLNLPHDEFMFSKNIVNPASPHFGYFTNSNLFGMITANNQLVYDCDADEVVYDKGINKGENLTKGKAFLQTLYDDLNKR